MVPVSKLEDKMLAVMSEYSSNLAWETKTVSSNDVRSKIVEEAEAFDADFVVLGARGANNKTPSSSLPLGSVTDYVVRHAPCNVVVVRKKNRKT